MCCSVINKDRVETIFAPLHIGGDLLKVQTFVPILGVVPAVAAVVIGLIACITAIVLKLFADKEAQEELNDVLSVSLLSTGYSVVNIISVGFFAPIHEYVTQFLSLDDETEEKTSTAGFFDIFPTLRRGDSIVFSGYFSESSSEET